MTDHKVFEELIRLKEMKRSRGARRRAGDYPTIYTSLNKKIEEIKEKES